MMIMQRKKGFTLIELLVVIAIIGILSSVVLASLNSARQKSRDAKRVSDIKQVQLALELYFDTNGEYPDALSKLVTGGFMPQLPTDPLGGNYVYNAYVVDTGAAPVAGNDCDEATEACVFYHLGASLENAVSATDTDLDWDGDVVNGSDADGCSNEANRVCYDVSP